MLRQKIPISMNYKDTYQQYPIDSAPLAARRHKGHARSFQKPWVRCAIEIVSLCIGQEKAEDILDLCEEASRVHVKK